MFKGWVVIDSAYFISSNFQLVVDTTFNAELLLFKYKIS
jgi:hypothetical protein